MPGEVWSHQLASSTLSIIQVAGRLRFTGRDSDRFVLLKDRVPVTPPFAVLPVAVSYAQREWLPIAHREIAG